MQRSYLDYAMSVIVGRALPDVRDGLKPVHRRVLYAMYDGGYRPDRALLQVRARRRRRHGQVPPARRHLDLRRPGPPGPAVVACGTRWSLGQGNFGSPGNDRGRPAVHRVQDGAAGHGDGPRHRRGDRRFPGQLRRPQPGADGPAGALPEPAGQRLRRASPSAWPPTSRRTTCARSPRASSGTWSTPTPPRGAAGRAHRADQGPGLPHRRADRGPQGHRGGVPHRPRLDHHARGRRGRGDPGPAVPGGHRAAVPGRTRTTWRRRSPTWSRTARSPASRTSATRPRPAPASAW